MVFEGSSAAISHTGKVRSNNQDSGFSGSNLFVVADGMGGHAGGDIASSIAVHHLEGLDHGFPTPAEAERELREAIVDAAHVLVDTVAERPELAGMGTTVSAVLMVDDYAVIAHIGDSRVYLFRDGAFTQITTDHTFVQRLVDSGRITPEEARYHPRRSVLMRVLGDMGTDPEVDAFIMQTQPGDRWLICSDGLCGVVDDAQTAKVLRQDLAPGRTADMLLKLALDAGAPDNVTIVLVDVGGRHPMYSGTATVVGSAATPKGIEIPVARPARTGWFQTGRQAANEPSHFEPAAEYLEELIEEDRRRGRRRRVWWFVGFIAIVAVIAAGVFAGYAWTQTRYFIGADDDSVVIYRGIQQDIGPISLSTPFEDTDILLADLPAYQRQSVEQTISARSLADAQAIVDNLRQGTP
ncbi:MULTISPECIES: PP2C family protein-serine/threonine phosphatase [Microbacterium]|uniref:Serine/threonine-protein phosphatase n=1 Tax=Microbacterium oleivorans TaxID=273677 RepID=A0A4R5YMB9_9MICO|nr:MULTISPECIES: PP2C family serine/threonine-protein phosphatase [Microbacterium]MDQ1126039.1 serine/threonine protein phosphatase PrpC [Microbacterium sp. SORGH_AS_0505]TDL45801.1 serine/threonine-protein phosphatase [Microbacterium oleivorans]SCY59829.1 protein phosphatase [Microbacterium sp. LKL04]